MPSCRPVVLFGVWGNSRMGVERYEVSKRFFLKKEAKTFAWLSPASPRQPCKSFLVLFFKKELLSLVNPA
jgi:hypothetical protein